MGADTHGENKFYGTKVDPLQFDEVNPTASIKCNGEWKNDCPYSFCKCAAKEATKCYSVTVELKPEITRTDKGYLFDFKGEKKFVSDSTYMFWVKEMMEAFSTINTEQIKAIHIKQISK